MASLLPAMVSAPGRKTVAFWWKERHHTTDMCTMGTSIKPIMPTTANPWARLDALSATLRSERCPT